MLVFSTDTEENEKPQKKRKGINILLNPDKINFSTHESQSTGHYLNPDIGNNLTYVIEAETNLNASSSTTVFPTQVAPPSTRVETTGHVEEAGSCVLIQSG